MRKYPFILFSLLLFPALSVGQDKIVHPIIEATLSFGTTETSGEKATLERLRAERDLLKNDWGISWSGSAKRKIGSGFIDPDEPLQSGRTYYSTGVDWNILDGGFTSSRRNANMLSQQIEIENLSQLQKARSLNYYKQFMFADYIFNLSLANIHQNRIVRLQNQKILADRLNEERVIGNEPVIEGNKRLTEAKHQLDYYQSAIFQFEQIFAEELAAHPAIPNISSNAIPDLLISDLIEAVDHQLVNQQMFQLKKDMMTSSNSWWSGIRLTASVDYNRQVAFDGEQRSYTSAGLSLRIPLTSASSRSLKNEWTNLKEKEIEEEHLYAIENTKKELLTYYHEYTYKQKQLQNFIHTKKIVEDRHRVQNLLQQTVAGDASQESILFVEDDLSMVRTEMIQIQQDALKILLKMNLLLVELDIRDFLETDTAKARYELPVAIMQMDEIQTYSTSLIGSYLHAKSVKHLFLQNWEMGEFEDVYQDFKNQGFEVYAVLPCSISSSKNPQNLEKMLESTDIQTAHIQYNPSNNTQENDNRMQLCNGQNPTLIQEEGSFQFISSLNTEPLPVVVVRDVSTEIASIIQNIER